MGEFDLKKELASMPDPLKERWAKEFGPKPAPSPASIQKPSDWQSFLAPAPPATSQVEQAQLAAFNRAPGSPAPAPSPAAAAPPAAAPATGRADHLPGPGGWDGVEKFRARLDADQRKANLAGATFADSNQEAPERPPAPAAAVGAGIGTGAVGKHTDKIETDTKEGFKPSEDLLAMRDLAREQGYQAIDTGAQAGRADAARELAYANMMSQAAAQHQLRAQKEVEDQQRLFQQEQQKRAQLAQDVRSGAIDDQQLFKQKGAVGSFMSSIGLALTSFVQGFHGGGPNTGLDIIKEQIANNIRAQEANLQTKKGALADQDAHLARLGGNMNLSRSNLENAYWEKAKAVASQMAAESKDSQVQAAAQKAVAAFSGEQEKGQEAFEKETQDHVARKVTESNAYGGGGGAAALGKGDESQIQEYVKETNKLHIPETMASLENIDRRIDAFGKGDIDGVSYALEHTPEVAVIGMNRLGLISDTALQNRQAFLDVKAKIKHDISGAAITETEKPELAKMVDGAYDATSLRNVINLVRSKVAKQEANSRAMLNDKALDEYKRRTQGRGVNPIREDKPTTPTIKSPE